MQPYLGPPWTDSHQIWAVDVFHHAPFICAISKRLRCFALLLYSFSKFILVFILLAITFHKTIHIYIYNNFVLKLLHCSYIIFYSICVFIFLLFFTRPATFTLKIKMAKHFKAAWFIHIFALFKTINQVNCQLIMFAMFHPLKCLPNHHLE